jgi:hypothetical protein
VGVPAPSTSWPAGAFASSRRTTSGYCRPPRTALGRTSTRSPRNRRR